MIIKIQWNEEKNNINIEENGIDFTDASKIIINDKVKIIGVKTNNVGGETLVGVGEYEGVMILIVFELIEDSIHILSARRASRRERDLYEAGIDEPPGEKSLGMDKRA